ISENVYVLIPRGHTVVNVTRNDSTLITYTTQQFNNTHIYVVFNASSQYRYTVYTRAWNSIYAMYSEHIYYGYSAPITAVIVLRDPFGNPIQSTQISWWSAYSSSPNFTTFTQVASGVVNTNASGVAIINTTAVNFDSYMLIQAELGGGYAGVSYITLRISAVNITYNIPDIATKNEPMQYNISAKMTLDNTPVARILVNGTAYGGSSITLSYTFNVSGYQQFIAGIAAVNGLAVGYVSVNKTIFVGGSVVWGVSIDPPMLYYIYNQPVTIYADLRYDNGQRPTRPIYLYINDAVITSSLPPLNTTIYISDNMNVILQYIDVDNRVYNYSLAAFMNYLNVNLSVYGTLTSMEFRMDVKVKEGVVGEYNAALYIIKEASENTYEIDRTIYGSNNKLALGGVKIVQKNTSVRITALLINYATSARNFTANIKLYVPYVGVISEANTSKTALANNIAYIDVNLSCVLNFNYPVFIEFNIVANDGEYLTYSSLTNIIKPQGFSVIKFTQVSSNRVTLSIDAVNESLYAYVAIVNNIKLSTPNSTIVELSNVRDAIAYVDITFPRRIYESGDVVDIAIDCVSNVKFRGSLKIYVDANLIAAWNVTTNTSLTYRYTIPSGMLSNVLYTHIIKVEFIEEISQSTMASKSQSIYVFNSGPNIQLVSPPEGSTINGTYTIDLAIDDPSKVASVLYRWDFENAWQNVSEPYDIVIDTLKLPNGVARLIVRAYDSKQFMSEKSFYFNIYNQVTEARVFSIWESVGNLIARYAFIPAIAIAAITMLIGFTLGKIMTKKPPQPIIVKLDKEKIERGRKR
ncbi:MAG: hypothetical protein RMI45_08665, partial [Ignisphaera sp.]|nr:hypothetical protein [Ignisphaera sp.]